MTAMVQLLTDLQAIGVTLVADGDRLRFHPRAAVTGELLVRLRDCKEALLAVLQPGYGGNGYTTPLKPDEIEGSVAVASVADPRDAVARPRAAVPVAVPWPGAADFCLLLAPDDLPPVPFKLNACTEVRDAAKMLRWLRAGIRRGPSGPRARLGTLQTDLLELRRFALQAHD